MRVVVLFSLSALITQGIAFAGSSTHGGQITYAPKGFIEQGQVIYLPEESSLREENSLVEDEQTIYEPTGHPLIENGKVVLEPNGKPLRDGIDFCYKPRIKRETSAAPTRLQSVKGEKRKPKKTPTKRVSLARERLIESALTSMGIEFTPRYILRLLHGHEAVQDALKKASAEDCPYSVGFTSYVDKDGERTLQQTYSLTPRGERELEKILVKMMKGSSHKSPGRPHFKAASQSKF